MSALSFIEVIKFHSTLKPMIDIVFLHVTATCASRLKHTASIGAKPTLELSARQKTMRLDGFLTGALLWSLILSLNLQSNKHC